jgi:hypothetical protein
MRMPVALSLAVPLALRAMAYAEKQTINNDGAMDYRYVLQR